MSCVAYEGGMFWRKSQLESMGTITTGLCAQGCFNLFYHKAKT